MTIDFTVDSIDGIDESLRGLYKESDDGKFVLDVQGVKPEDEFTKVHGLLQTERNTRKQYEEKLKQFGERNPEDYYALEDQIEQLKLTQGEIDESKLNELLEAKMKPVTRQQERLASERDAALQELQQIKQSMRESARERSIMEAANGKIKPEFMQDLKLRAMHQLEYSEDMDSFLDEGGLNVEEWVMKQIKETPAWMPDSVGAGAKSKTGNRDTSDSNPFTEKGWNMTEQARIFREDPKKYERLKAESGNPRFK